MAVGAIVLEDSDVRVPADVFDLEGFRRWVHSPGFPEGGRFSFIAGEVLIDMSPEEIQSHGKTKIDTTGDLRNWVILYDLGDLLPDGTLLVNDDADLSTEPDLMFCSWDSLRSGRVLYREWVEGSNRQVEVYGSPDMVLEIISRSSVRKDTVLLPPRYFAAGIAEYWLIDARDEIDFRIYTRGEDDWVLVKKDRQGYRRSTALAGRFKLTRKRNPVGGNRYTLLAKAL